MQRDFVSLYREFYGRVRCLSDYSKKVCMHNSRQAPMSHHCYKALLSSLKTTMRKKIVFYRKFRLHNPKSFHYQRKNNNHTQVLIELQYIQLTPMTSNTPPTLEETISKPTSLKYRPINNQINNLK